MHFIWLFQIKGVSMYPNSRHVHAGFKAIVPRSGKLKTTLLKLWRYYVKYRVLKRYFL